jgi:type III secretory pathway component EscT
MRTGLIVRAGEPVKTRQLNAGERANMLFRLLPMIGTALSIGMVLGTVLSHT